MTELIIPQYLCLDTATIGKLAQAAYSKDRSKASLALEIRDAIQRHGWLVLFTAEHLLEICQHENEGTILERMKYLRGFEWLATIRPFNNDSRPGSFIDVDLHEISAVLNSDGESSFADVVAQVRAEVFDVRKSNDTLGGTVEEIRLFAEKARQLHKKSQLTTSVARTDPAGVKQKRLRDFVDTMLEDRSARQSVFEHESTKMTAELESMGDHRLRQHGEISNDFYDGVLQMLDDLETHSPIRDGSDLIERLARKFNVPVSMVSPRMTVGEFSALIFFSMNLSIYSRGLGRRLTLQDITPKQLPSWRLREQLEACQNRADRVEGGNSIDRRLAGLAFYADACEVDKRTLEYLRQIRQRENKSHVLDNAFRVRGIEDLLSIVTSDVRSACE